MGASALEQDGFAPAAVRQPRLVMFAVVAVAGGWAAGCSLALALTNDSIGNALGQPLVIALLSVWITLSYVLCGLLAWWHRPASRFGPLMIAAGFGNFLVTLSWATSSGPFTLGQMLDLVPPVLFLHLFVAFPSGRLQKGFERNLVVTGYALAVGLEVVRMTLGGLALTTSSSWRRIRTRPWRFCASSSPWSAPTAWRGWACWWFGGGARVGRSVVRSR